MRSPIRDERGSALLLTAFLAVLLTMAIALVVDVGTVLAHRRGLAATADAAAMAGAQAIDLAAYYGSGPDSEGVLELDPTRARVAVLDHLAASRAWERHPGLRVVAVSVADGEVVVSLRSQARLPMISVFGIDSAPVSAASGARLVIQP